MEGIIENNKGKLRQLQLTPISQETYDLSQILPNHYKKLTINNFCIKSFHMYAKGGDYGAGYGNGKNFDFLSYDATTGILTITTNCHYTSSSEAGTVSNDMKIDKWTIVVNY